MPGRLRRLLPLITAAVAIPTAALFAAGASGARGVATTDDWQPQIVADSPAAAARYVAKPASADPATLGTLVAARYLPRALPPGVGIEKGLQVKTLLAERMISAKFPEIHEIGGVRPDALKWHPNGLAIDVIIPDYGTPAGKALGDRIVAFAFDNAARIGLEAVIWQQTYMPVDGPRHLMADLGSPDANHYTHVHIATTGGGYPTGAETYVG